ncbi:MAG: sigma-70 family RNA polymerase sigma factor, partial [Anaerostipes sp.]|nr:sigma-70 family RNA polymerase sigma factor [Anaerostipes sp.]
MIYRMVKKYRNIDKMTDIDDLMQQAYLGLVEAVDRYEQEKGVLLLSYATYWIVQSVKRYLEQCGRVMYLPAHTQEKVYKYNQVTGSYLSQYNREPTDEEYCCWLEFTQKQLDSLRHTMRISIVESIERPLDEEFTIGDTIVARNGDMEAVEDTIAHEQLWDAIHEAVKDEKDIEALELKYKDGCTLKEASERMGCTPERVRIRQNKAMRKLRSNRKIMEIGEEEGIISISKVRKERRQSSINYRSIWNDLTDEEQKSMRMLI